MADLIDRYAVVYKLKSCITIPAEDEWDGGYNSAMSEAMQYIQNAQAVNRWIPCSERLPVLYVPVMIFTDDGLYAIAHVTENEDEYLWFGDGGHYSKDYVLFWMPLPEPPESEVQKNAIT